MKGPLFKTFTAAFVILSAGCSNPTKNESKQEIKSLDIAMIQQNLALKGVEKDGEYKITVPQNDLNVVVDSFKIIPPMGLGSWAAFTSTANGAMVMGDIIVTETELKFVQAEVINQGLTITAIHNHFVRDKPHIMYMHISGMGTEQKLAKNVRTVFEIVNKVRGHNPAEGVKDDVQNTLDTAALNKIIGIKGEMSRGVYKHTLGRPDVDLKDHNTSVSSFIGFNTWAAWQGTPERAAVAGDFAMLEDEVAAVINSLVQNGIEVVAVHNHMVHEKPRIFFLHYWGVGPVNKLANGLKEALTQIGKKNTDSSASLFPGVTEVLCKN